MFKFIIHAWLILLLGLPVSSVANELADFTIEFHLDNRQGDYTDQTINLVQCSTSDCAPGTDGTMQEVKANQLSHSWRITRSDGSTKPAVKALAITAQDKNNPQDEKWYRVCILKTDSAPKTFTLIPTWANTNGPCAITTN